MGDKKYILTDEMKPFGFTTVHRIQAIRDFGEVKAGDLGGWVESEENLSHEGSCWIYNEAIATNCARVVEDAEVDGHSTVSRHAIVSGNACIRGCATVTGHANVDEYAVVDEHAIISDMAKIRECALVKGRARVFDCANVSGYAIIRGNSIVSGQSRICGDARVLGDAYICNGVITKTSDYLVLGPLGSRSGFTTFFRGDGAILVTCGCFKGTIDEFLIAVQKTHGDNEFAKGYQIAVDTARKYFNILV